MTVKTDAKRARWRRLLASTRARVEVVALSLVLLLCGVVALAGVPAVADDEKLAGEPVPDDAVPAIVAAALSCPSLNPPKLAAQIMAASGFAVGGRYRNIAAMDPATWAKWRPALTARATDRDAAITAMAHRTCELVGQVRAGGLGGDLWPAAVAAEQAGVAAVIAAKGVPAAQKQQVDKVAGYARWYADQPEFSAATPAGSAAAPGAVAVPVPDDLVPAVKAAGAICPAITPVRVAAQLRAMSNFDANLRSDSAREGIAQFTAELWQSYRTSRTASVWDPQDAITSLGRAMCGLTGELGFLGGGDPYVLALGAYQWGAKAVRQAGGLPRAAVPQLVDQVVGHMAEYEKDSRLKPTVKETPGKAKPGKSKPATGKPSTPAPSTSAPAKGGQSETPTPKRDQPPVKAGGSGGPYGPYFLFNHRTSLCADEQGTGVAPRDSPVALAGCAKQGTDNQEWQFVPHGVDDDGYQLYWIRNIDDSYCIDPPTQTAAPNESKLSVTGCFDQDNQDFRLEPTIVSAGWQYYWLRNTASDMCFEIPGAGTGTAGVRLQLVPCLTGDDHDWALVEKGEW